MLKFYRYEDSIDMLLHKATVQLLYLFEYCCCINVVDTWWTTAHRCPTLPIVNGNVLPVVMKSLYHVTGSVPMGVGHLLLLARLPSLPDDKWDPEVSEDSNQQYRQSMKTLLFAQY